MKDNPFVVRGVAKWLALFAGGVVLTVALLFANIPFWAVFAIVLIVYLLITMGWPLYVLYVTKDRRKIDAFLTKNRSNPLFAYAYAVGHESDEAVIGTLETILQTYKQKKVQSVYAANLAVWQQDADALHRLAVHLPTADYVNYYTAAAVLMEGDTERADTLQKAIRKPWMAHALAASIAKERDDQTACRREQELAAAHARGIQHYVLASIFQRDDRFSPTIQ